MMKFYRLLCACVLLIPLCSFAGKESKKEEKSDKEKVEEAKPKLKIPDAIKKIAPENLQPYVYFNAIVGIIKSHYVEEISDDKIAESAIVGLLNELDPHSSYLNEKAFSALKEVTAGSEFGGLGIIISAHNGLIKIVAPIEDSPGFKAGLKSGDVITHIDGSCIRNIPQEEIVEKRLKGKPGTKVKLKVFRFGQGSFDVVIERAIIKPAQPRSEVFEKIGYIRIPVFEKGTTKEVREILEKMIKEKSVDGLVIDVRDNGGGLLDEAVDLSDTFLGSGEIVSVKGQKEEQKFSSTGKDSSDGIPMVVLVNAGSASASEIFAGAMQDNKRAIVVGIKTFGKGSVQKVIPLSENTGIKLTVARYYLPSGRCIQGKGVEPDIKVETAVMRVIKEDNLCERDLPNSLSSPGDKKCPVGDKDSDKSKDKTKEDKKVDDTKKADDDKKKQEADQEKDLSEDDIFEELRRKKPKDQVALRKLSLKSRLKEDVQLSRAFDVVRGVIISNQRRGDK